MDLQPPFQALTGHPPNRWQTRLFEDWLAKGVLPFALDLPTGLGKTSVMALWLIARSAGAALPRRLVYVVDRRAVVDQATVLANELAERALAERAKEALPDLPALAVSTLRGKSADNRRWLDDPVSPAIIVGTIDMIGSRLLFEGYGVSRGMRPFQAGLLGADSLFVLDEAHLCPPFEALMTAIGRSETFRGTDAAFTAAVPGLRVLSLSATGRRHGEPVFRLTEADHDDWTGRRLSAAKRLTLADAAAGKDLAGPLADRAWSLGGAGTRVLVFCDRRSDALKLAELLRKKGGKAEVAVELLTGARRVHEREELAGRLERLGFLRGGNTPPAREAPAFLVATSAGEVGIDLDADHMVCDLVAVERMIQRLGRVNRSGGAERVARVEVLAPPGMDPATRERLEAPLRALPPLDGGSFDASPQALSALRRDHAALVDAATTAVPLHPALDRAVVDAWSLTSLDDHPGRPATAPWLRGWVEDDDGPAATVLWRHWLPWRAGAAVVPADAEAFFAAAPPHLRECLEAPLGEIRKTLTARAKAAGLAPDAPAVIVLSSARTYRDAFTVGELASELGRKGRDFAPGDLIVVSAALGGLSGAGHLDDKAGADDLPGGLDAGWDEAVLSAIGYRVAGPGESPPGDWKPAHHFPLTAGADEDENEDEAAAPAVTVWTLRQPGDGPRRGDPAISRRAQALDKHHGWTEDAAREIARGAWPGAAPDQREHWTLILTTAARLHDLGKDRVLWQRAMGAPLAGRPFAKTEGGGNPRLLDGYRHEFGSLGDAERHLDALGLSMTGRDLVLHLIASHHGHARPTIPPRDPDRPPSANAARAAEAALRFARLQHRLGPWGLAWWEALLRAADQRASRRLDAEAR